MRIEGTRAPTIEGAGRKKKTQSTSPSFSMERSAGAAATTRTAPTESPLFIEPQDAVDPDEQRKQQQQRGNAMLDSLDHLYVATLTGVIDMATIKRIQAQLAEQQRSRDEGVAIGGSEALQDISETLAEIETRLAVELAKRNVAPS